MILLLAEDELLTREGLLKSIPWRELGIDAIIQAEDGVNGLEKALSERPDIVLTDVRMPRMNGVEMSFAIREKLPDVSIVFMSGFSDKEYLKSAIRLSAVNYIEKPIDPQELTAALRTAVERQLSLAVSREAVADTRHRLDLSFQAMKNQVALDLVRRQPDRAKTGEQMRLVYPGIERAGWWVVLIVSVLEPQAREAENRASALDSVCALLEGRFGAGEEAVQTMVGRMDDHSVVAHLNTGGGDFDAACAAAAAYCYRIRDTLKSVCDFQLVMGKPVPSLELLPDSFRYAQENRRRGFFYRPQSIMMYRDAPSPVCALSEEMLLPLKEALRRRDEERANELIYRLFQGFYQGEGTPEGALKHFIFGLMQMIRQEASLAAGEGAAAGGAEARTRQEVFAKQFLYELESLVQAEVRAFFAADAGQADKPMLAIRIQRYIDENFCDPQLSLSSLAASFGVSESHLCVVYRRAFGVTLNQRITGLRIEKAQKLLLGGERKVKEIAEEAGYPDSNYFIKLFKKHTGVTPQEYRGH